MHHLNWFLEDALLRDHVKRRGLLVRERTQAAVAAPLLFQLHEVADHLFDDGGFKDLRDSGLGDHGQAMRLTKILCNG